MKKMTLTSAVIAAAVGLLLPLMAAAPAQAAASCYNIGSNGSVATATCSGTGYARLNVRCNAYAPFPVWTDYGTRTYVNGGLTLVNSHAYCAAPLTVYVTYG